MHLATLAINGSPRAAVRLDDGSVLDIAAASDKLTGTAADALRSGSLQAVIACGQPALDAIAGLIEQAKADNGVPESARIAASDARFLAPLPSPSKNVFCVGRNYSEHIAEGDRAQKQKVDGSLAGHSRHHCRPACPVDPFVGQW